MPRTRAFDETEVLLRARDLFWEHGYTATSIDDLEKHLGISRSSLYRTFGGKRQLYDRTLGNYQQENLGRLRETLFEAPRLRERLQELFTGTALRHDAKCKSGSRGCYIVNVTTEMANACSRALDFVAANREQFVVILRGALLHAQQLGQLRPEADCTALANYLFLCYNGLQVVVQTNADRATLVKAVALAIEGLPWMEK